MVEQDLLCGTRTVDHSGTIALQVSRGKNKGEGRVELSYSLQTTQVYTKIQCGKPAIRARLLHSKRTALAICRGCQCNVTDTPNTVRMPALDHMVQDYRAVQLQCISIGSACTTLV